MASWLVHNGFGLFVDELRAVLLLLLLFEFMEKERLDVWQGEVALLLIISRLLNISYLYLPYFSLLFSLRMSFESFNFSLHFLLWYFFDMLLPIHLRHNHYDSTNYFRSWASMLDLVWSWVFIYSLNKIN